MADGPGPTPQALGVEALRRIGRARRRLDRYRRKARGVLLNPDDRLVPSPVFVISSVRSGSTLLRVLLNSHSQICAPHEMHLRTLQVQLTEEYTELAMAQLGLDARSLENLLWDRVLHRELVRSGKRLVVDKTPGNAHVWQRLHEAWPDARYLFLLRHPGAMVASMARARPEVPVARHVQLIGDYVRVIDAARAGLSGHEVRYEELTQDPETVMRGVCRYLGVPFEAAMLQYGEASGHGSFKAKIGDWSANIRSGAIQDAAPPPPEEDLPPEVAELVSAWGY